MRRGISIAMALFGLSIVITGIWNFFPPFNQVFFTPHVINSSIFGVLAALHVWLNRKPIIRHFRELGWRWVLVGILIAAVTWNSIILPILMVGGIVSAG